MDEKGSLLMETEVNFNLFEIKALKLYIHMKHEGAAVCSM